MDHLADPSYSTALFTSQTVEETGEAVKTVDETTLADVSRQLTLRLLSGDGESLDSVDTSSAEYQTQYQTVHDALAKNGSSYQVLATKVNNAVKLSIEKYISEYNKDHAKAKTLEDGTASRRAVSPSLRPRASSATTPTARSPHRCWASATATARLLRPRKILR